MLEVKKPKSWCKSVSAFANGLGGVLVFGISASIIVGIVYLIFNTQSMTLV